MKINWGTGVVLAFIGFMAFILYFVFKASFGNHGNYQLVTEKYYQKELDYQEEIDAEKAAIKAGAKPILIHSDEGLIIEFPYSARSNEITGTASFYRPSNSKMDFGLPVDLVNGKMLVPSNLLKEGRWDLTINWVVESAQYQYKEKLRF